MLSVFRVGCSIRPRGSVCGPAPSGRSTGSHARTASGRRPSTVCGVLSGANSFAGIQEFGCDRRPWFARYLDLRIGFPSDDTFARVLARLDPAAFETCLLDGLQAVQEVSGSRLIAIDGKTLRGSYDRGDGKAAIQRVPAWAVENQLSLGQVVVDEKSNEITAIPDLLRLLELSGALVTIDAMGCQKEIADLIRDGGADDVLAVKQNQPTLYEQAEAAIGAGLEQETAIVDVHQTMETDRGRHETRTRYDTPQRPACADAVRGHWSIENNLHCIGNLMGVFARMKVGCGPIRLQPT